MSDRYPWGNYFTNRKTGVGVRIEDVTENWATLVVQAQLTSTFKMPLTDYNNKFVKQYIPLDTGSMRLPDNFMPPANWRVWADEGLPARNLPRATQEDTRDADEKAVDAIDAAETARDAEDESATVPEAPQQPVKATPTPVNGKDPEALEEDLKSRLAGR